MELRGSRVLNRVRMGVACMIGFCVGFPISTAVLSAYPDRGRDFLLIALALMSALVWLWLEYVNKRQKARRATE